MVEDLVGMTLVAGSGGYAAPDAHSQGTPNRVRYVSLVFFASGLCGLVYQVAWQRLLTIHFGVGVVSITLIVSAWMLGLGSGAAVGGRLADTTRRPWRAYGLVEAALAGCGLASLFVGPAVAAVAAQSAQVVAFALLFALLSAPTFLMGMTLPLLASSAAGSTRHRDFLGLVSRLYHANTLGAAAGAVVTGYVLISWVGLDGSVLVAAALNLLLAALALLVLARRPSGIVASPSLQGRPATASIAPPLGDSSPAFDAALLFTAGFLAIGYEIVWYRLVGVLVKDSPYAFSSVLATYLVGIAAGSRLVRRFLASRPRAPRRELFHALQFLVGLSALVLVAAFHHFAASGPLAALVRTSFASEAHPSLAVFASGPHGPADLFLLLDVFLWPALLVLAPATLMGACFPLMASVEFDRRQSEGRAVGFTYAAMVAGNVLGALLTGLVLLGVFGTERTLLGFGCVGLLFGLGVRLVAGRTIPARTRAIVVAVAVACAVLVFPRAGELYKRMHVSPFEPATVLVREGLDAVVVTYARGERLRNFVNGQGHGYRPGAPFLAEAAEGLAHAPSLRRVLVIGFGAGSIVQAALRPLDTGHVTLVELCPSVLHNARAFPALAQTLDDPRVAVVEDDGRRFLARSGDTYDTILMDPLRTTTAYSNNLHSREFFVLTARHLAPGGVLMVGGLGEAGVVARTLLEVFPRVRAYTGFCLASAEPLRRDPARVEAVLAPLTAEMRADVEALRGEWLEGSELVEATRPYRVNRDARPVSEYYLGSQFR